MKKRRILSSLALLCLLGVAGTAQAATPPGVVFNASDNSGGWFECMNSGVTFSVNNDIGCVHLALGPETVGKSLAVIKPGQSVAFASQRGAQTIHTAVSLIYPTVAGQGSTASMPFDNDLDPGASNAPITLQDEGLYVFFCDIHPYMFAGVIVTHNPVDAVVNGTGLKLGTTLTLHNVIAPDNTPELTMYSYSDLALRFVHTFFIATNPANWQNFSTSAKWTPQYPGVPVLASANGSSYNAGPVNLNTALQDYFGETGGKTLTAHPTPPQGSGVGQVWVDTQFEKTNKEKPGTVTAVDSSTWKVTNKVALRLNNPHNLWASADQKLIYQTEWFDQFLSVFDRVTGGEKGRILVGPAPAHVMTRTTNDEVHVSLNGGNDIVELTAKPKTAADIERNIPMGPTAGGAHTHPHAHWMSANGKMMVTPNADSQDSTLYDFYPYNHIGSKIHTGHFPIATGMMPDSSKYYVANFLDSTISVLKIHQEDGNMPTATWKKNINILLDGYDTAGLTKLDGTGHAGGAASAGGLIKGFVGGLPIQTPVSPDGKYVITANTLTGTILVIDTKTDMVVQQLGCDAGCHGVQWGAKKGGGYYAYVSSKFSNRMLVVDPKSGSDATIVGSVLLTTANAINGFQTDADRTSFTSRDNALYEGMGGQGVLPIPLVYNGWVQHLPAEWKAQLTYKQIHPINNEDEE